MTVVDDSILKEFTEKLDNQVKRNEEIKKYLTLEGLSIPVPPRASPEHRRIAENSKTPWARLFVETRVDRLRVSGVRDSEGSNDHFWGLWRTWKMTKKEHVIYSDSMAYGASFVELRKMPGNKTMPFVKSPFRFVAFYETDSFFDPMNAEHPVAAIEFDGRSTYKVWDDYNITYFHKLKKGFEAVKVEAHGGNGVVPIVRYVNDIDSDGYSVGEIAPVKHLLDKIFNENYNHGTINHSNSWNTKYATGLAKFDEEEPAEGESQEEFVARVGSMQRQLLQELGTADILYSTEKDTKFGILPATNPAAMIPVLEANLKEFSAVTKTPSSYITGDTVGLSAEQASNAHDNFLSDIERRKEMLGESHETLFALHIRMTGDPVADDPTRVVTWWDRDNGSIGAKVDALGKEAQMLKVPERELWDEIPNMTPEKLERYKAAADERDRMANAAMAQLANIGNESRSPEEIAYDMETEE